MGTTSILSLAQLRVASLSRALPHSSQLLSPGVSDLTHGTGSGHPGSQVGIGTGAGFPG